MDHKVWVPSKGQNQRLEGFIYNSSTKVQAKFWENNYYRSGEQFSWRDILKVLCNFPFWRRGNGELFPQTDDFLNCPLFLSPNSFCSFTNWKCSPEKKAVQCHSGNQAKYVCGKEYSGTLVCLRSGGLYQGTLSNCLSEVCILKKRYISSYII